MKFILQNAWAAWLGATLSIFADIHFWNWQFYAIFLPTAVLVAFSHIAYQE